MGNHISILFNLIEFYMLKDEECNMLKDEDSLVFCLSPLKALERENIKKRLLRIVSYLLGDFFY